MAFTRLMLVRHGETAANREFRYLGARDDLLTEKGQEQALQLAKALQPLPLAAVYSSPLQRAYQTAQAIARPLALDVQVREALRECNFGTWEGLSRAEVLARSSQDAELLQRWEEDMQVAPPEGESFARLSERVLTEVSALAARHIAETIVIVSHVGPIKTLLAAALDIPLTSASRIFLDPATISVIDWQETRSLVRLVNGMAHPDLRNSRWLSGK